MSFYIQKERIGQTLIYHQQNGLYHELQLQGYLVTPMYRWGP